MITYNHAKFIAQAIDSVLMQRTQFDFELVIGDDTSTDDTREIVLSYQAKYPAIIRPLSSDGNLGITRNFARALGSCSGQFIALLDGDDYWTSPYKLQRQVDFLDTHPDCVLCFHPVRVHQDGEPGQPASILTRTDKNRLTLDDLLASNGIQTASVMLRAGVVGELPAWYYGLPMEDWPLYLLLAQRGSLCHLSDAMAAYRMHAASAWSSTSVAKRARDSIALLETIARHMPLDAERAAIACRAIGQYRLQIAIDDFGRGDRVAARAEVARAIEAFPAVCESEDLVIAAFMSARSGHPPATNELLIRGLFAEVLPRTRTLSRAESRLTALMYMKEVFEGLAEHDTARVDAYIWPGVSRHPMWLTNRGVLATAVRSFLRQTRARLRSRSAAQ